MEESETQSQTCPNMAVGPWAKGFLCLVLTSTRWGNGPQGWITMRVVKLNHVWLQILSCTE